MANDKDHGYNKADLKVKRDRVLHVSNVKITGGSAELSVGVYDYGKPDKKTHDLTVSIPLSELEGTDSRHIGRKLDTMLAQEARRLVAIERAERLINHQTRVYLYG